MDSLVASMDSWADAQDAEISRSQLHRHYRNGSRYINIRQNENRIGKTIVIVDDNVSVTFRSGYLSFADGGGFMCLDAESNLQVTLPKDWLDSGGETAQIGSE